MALLYCWLKPKCRTHITSVILSSGLKFLYWRGRAAASFMHSIFFLPGFVSQAEYRVIGGVSWGGTQRKKKTCRLFSGLKNHQNLPCVAFTLKKKTMKNLDPISIHRLALPLRFARSVLKGSRWDGRVGWGCCALFPHSEKEITTSLLISW